MEAEGVAKLFCGSATCEIVGKHYAPSCKLMDAIEGVVASRVAELKKLADDYCAERDAIEANWEALNLQVKDQERSLEIFKQERDYWKGLAIDAKAGWDKAFIVIDDAYLKVRDLWGALESMLRIVVQSDEFNDEQCPPEIKGRVKVAREVLQKCAEKMPSEAPAFSFTHSSPMKGDRYLDGASTCWEYDGKEWVKAPPQLLIPDGSAPPPKDGVPAGEGLRFVNDSITFRKEGVMSFIPPNLLYAKLSGAQVEIEKLLQESKEDFQNAERQLSERDAEIERLKKCCGDTIDARDRDQKGAELQKSIAEAHVRDLIEAIDQDHHLSKGGPRLDGHSGCEVCAIIERGTVKGKCVCVEFKTTPDGYRCASCGTLETGY